MNDGQLGVATTERAGFFEDCAEVGHPPDLTAYQAGRTEGLKAYCTAASGYRVGYEGRPYEGVCPPTLAADFEQGYVQGRRDRPSVGVYPGFGIGIGSGGVRTRVGVGIGLGWFGFGGCGHGYGRHRPYGGGCW